MSEGDLVIAITKAVFFTDDPIDRMLQAQANTIRIAKIAQIHDQNGFVRLEKPPESDYLPHQIDPGRTDAYISPESLVDVEYSPECAPVVGVPKKNEEVLVKLADRIFVRGTVLHAGQDTGWSTVIVRSRSGIEGIFQAITNELYHA